MTGDTAVERPGTQVAGGRAVLRVRGLVKRFGRVEVLRGLDMTVEEGEVYGFLGRNGSGKTTTLRACMGIVSTDAGRLEILGTEVRRPTVAQKREIGYVSQEQNFYAWMRCAALGRFVGAFYPAWDADEFRRLLRALDVPPDRKVAQLSGGMRAKLGLALALAHRPRLLLLDEPTAGLDAAARREFLEIVRTQAADGRHATLFSSHIVEEVERVADRVGILDRGRLVFEGRPAELRATVRSFRPADLPVPEGGAPAPTPEIPAPFEVVSRAPSAGGARFVLRASEDAWESEPFPPGTVTPLPLEEIFLALTVGRALGGPGGR